MYSLYQLCQMKLRKMFPVDPAAFEDQIEISFNNSVVSTSTSNDFSAESCMEFLINCELSRIQQEEGLGKESLLELLKSLRGAKYRLLLTNKRLRNEFRPLSIDLHIPLLELAVERFRKDSELAASILKTFFTNNGWQLNMLASSLSSEHLEYIFAHACSVKFALRGMQLRGDCNANLRDPIMEYLYDGIDDSINFRSVRWQHKDESLNKFKCASLYITYGFNKTFQARQYRSMCYGIYGSICRRISSQGFEDNEIRRLVAVRNPRLVWILELLYFIGYQSHLHPEVKRILTAISRSTTDTHVTPDEMYHSLRSFLNPSFKLDLSDICDRYRESKIHDDDYTVKMPRTLSHLSRCAIRERLCQSFQLPLGIQNLPLTEKLKSFLRLEC